MAPRVQEPSVPAPSSPPRQEDEAAETISEDDLCPICHLLFFRPVTTNCNHTLCGSCMAHWADVSVTTQMTIVSLDEEPSDFDPIQVEANCPMCRRPTTASLNTQLAEQLSARYPLTYSERRADEQASEADGSESAIETLTLYIGNKHRLIRPAEDSSNRHEWTFFVRPSRTDIIEEVQILIHPTFRPSRIIRTSPPYEIRRIGWGYFTITAQVILRAGYTWVSEDAETAPDGARKRMLSLDWNLDFDGFGGRGSMGRCRLKVRSEAGRGDMDVVEGDE